MTVAIYILAALVLLMLAGSIPVGGGGESAVFRTPVFILLLAAVSVSLLVCSIRRRLVLRHAGFHLAHLSVVLILFGASLGVLFEKRAEQLYMAVGTARPPRVIPLPAERGEISAFAWDERTGTWRVLRRGVPMEPAAKTVDLGFGLGVKSLRVTRFPPEYTLYRAEVVEREGAEVEELSLERTVSVPPEGRLDLGPAGQVDVKELRHDDGRGAWKKRVMLEGGRLLYKSRHTDKEQLLALEVTEEGKTSDLKVRVNHPGVHGGWRFYLMDYDRDAESWVVLTARRDPGRGAVIAGCWGLMAGVALMCLVRPSRTSGRPEQTAEGRKGAGHDS